MDTIDRTELMALLEGPRPVRVLMAMGPEAYARAHIPGSAPLDEAAVASISPDDDVVVYCTHEACSASIHAQRALRSAGVRRVRRYAGGLTDWVEAGLPVAEDAGVDLAVAA